VNQPSKGVLATNAYLWLTHILSTIVFARQPPNRRLAIDYSEFAADPLLFVSRITEFVEVGRGERPDLEHLETGVPVQGNRLLQSQVVSFRRESERSGRGSIVTSILQAPVQAVHRRLVTRQHRNR
jgi:hypothetical protein